MSAAVTCFRKSHNSMEINAWFEIFTTLNEFISSECALHNEIRREEKKSQFYTMERNEPKKQTSPFLDILTQCRLFY